MQKGIQVERSMLQHLLSEATEVPVLQDERPLWEG